MHHRAMLGLARTGSFMGHRSGDFAIAVSTANRVRDGRRLLEPRLLRDDAIDPLFLAAVEAVEEAVYNSLTRAKTVRDRDGHVAEAIPIERLRELLAQPGRR